MTLSPPPTPDRSSSDQADLDAEAADRVAEAVRRLAAGEPVGVPTETVYGLAADAMNPSAVQRIFDLKGRPSSNPLSCLVESAAMGRRWLAASWPPAADALAAAFWPGPLTIVLPRQGGIPDIVTAGQDTIGIRVPDQPLTLAVLRRLGRPLAAPSANRSGDASPVTADDVHRAFADHPDLLVLDGGRCRGGVESTVVRIEVPPANGDGEATTVVRILRPGMLSESVLQRALGASGVVVGPTTGPHGNRPGPGASTTAEAAAVDTSRGMGAAGPTASTSGGVAGGAACEVLWFTRDQWSMLRSELTADDIVLVIGSHPEPAGIAAARVIPLPDDDVACGREFYAAFHAARAESRRVFLEWPMESTYREGTWPALRFRIGRLGRAWL